MITAQYGFWLAIISIVVFAFERISPWRTAQPWNRPQLAQDIAWFIFNGYFVSKIFGGVFALINGWSDLGFAVLTGRMIDQLRSVHEWPIVGQAAVVLIVGDFIEWCVHNLLHRIPWLWRIHRVHHSIKAMDWIGNFRFHWGEIFVYQSAKHLPFAFLGAGWQAMLIAALISTTVGHLNHANIDLSWGPLRYVLNSPRMHIWHHDKFPVKPNGVNFAIVFSLWDYLFATAYLPRDRSPIDLGFKGEERTSRTFAARFIVPFLDRQENA